MLSMESVSMYKFNKTNEYIDNIIGLATILLVCLPVILFACYEKFGKEVIKTSLHQNMYRIYFGLLVIAIVVIWGLIITMAIRTINQAFLLYLGAGIINFIGLGFLLKLMSEFGLIASNEIATLWVGFFTLDTILLTIINYINSKQLVWEFSILPQKKVSFDKRSIPIMDSDIKIINVKARCNKKISKLVFVGFCNDGKDERKVARRQGDYLSKIYSPRSKGAPSKSDMERLYKQLRIKKRYSYDSRFSVELPVEVNSEYVKEHLDEKTKKNKKWLVFIDGFGEFFGMPVYFKKKTEGGSGDESNNGSENSPTSSQQLGNKLLPVPKTENLFYDVDTKVEYWGQQPAKEKGEPKALTLRVDSKGNPYTYKNDKKTLEVNETSEDDEKQLSDKK